MRPGWAAVALTLAGGTALAGDRDPLAGRIAGAPENCISLSAGTSPTIAAADTILYRQSGRRIWRTGPVGQCARLRPMDTLVIEVFGGRLCRNDRFRILSPGQSIASAPCRFDAFVPYDTPR